jgi:hypothetical protein
LFDLEVTRQSDQLLPVPPPTIHDTFDHGDTTTTAFPTLLGVLVIVVLLALVVMKGLQYLIVGPLGF